MDRSVNRNLPLLFLIKVCKWFMLYMPVVKLFYAENNLDDFDLFFLHAIYSAVIFLIEVPSGYLADIWGRKNSLLLGLLLGITGFSFYSFTAGFWGFLIAEIALGIGEGFISGSDSALLYDTLFQQKKQEKYIRYEGRITGGGNLAEALAGVTVTFLALNPLRGYYYLQTILTLAGFIAAWFLIEPKVHTHERVISWKAIVNIVKDTLWHNPVLSRYVIFSAIIGFSSLTMAWLAQIFLFQAKIPNTYFGIIWAVLNGMVALGSILSHRIDNFLGQKLSLVYIFFFLSAGYFVASGTIAPYGLVFLLVFYFVRGTAHPILKDRIQAFTESGVRATVLSVRSLIIRIMFALLGPVIGIITEKISLSVALLTSGSIILIPGLFLVILINKKK